MSDKEPKQEKKEKRGRYPKLEIPLFLFPKAKKEGVTLSQLMLYSWYYTKNYYKKGGIYGRPNYKSLDREAEDELQVTNVEKLRLELERKGWLKKSAAEPFNGKRQVGCLCMLNAEQAAMAKAVQQEMQIPDEEAVIEVESSLPDTGEYVQFGIRYYDDADGNPHQVPTSAPPRPTKTAVWSSDPEGWYEPSDLPERDCEY